MALDGHDGHPVLDDDGNIDYHSVVKFLFGENVKYMNNAYRRNTKFCVSVPCFSKNIYAINFYSYEYEGGSLNHNCNYMKYGMGFDLLTTNTSEKIESFRYDYFIPCNTTKWTPFDTWRSEYDLRRGRVMVSNVHYMMKGLRDSINHLRKAHNLVFSV